MIFAHDLGVPEGPVLLDDGSLLVVEMRPDRGCITKLDAAGRRERVLAQTGRPNGLAMHRDGSIWVAESSAPSLLKLAWDGSVERVADGVGHEPFLFPNDLAFGPDGLLYMTDSGIRFEDFAPGGRVREDWRSLHVDGRVYRIDTNTGAVEMLDRGLAFPNGVAFGPDDCLYVNETLTGDVIRYAEWRDARPAAPTIFGNVVDPYDEVELRGPDGMKFASNGHLYVTVFGQGDIVVLDRQGQVVERIRTAGRAPTNLVFGPSGTRRIYVTEDQVGTVELLEVEVDGLTLHDGTAAA